MSRERERDEIDELIDSLDELPDPPSGGDDYDGTPAEWPVEEDFEEPPDKGFADESWTHINIHTSGRALQNVWPFNGYSFDNKCWSEWATNDDNDDGVDDGEIVRATYQHESVWAALYFHNGGTRQGVLSAVTVVLDGCIVFTKHGPGWKEYRPYCRWPREENKLR